MLTALPRRPRRPTGVSAASMIHVLANRDTLDPEEAAAVLELEILRIEQLTVYRREYQLGANHLWNEAAAVVGGHGERWRVLDLVPRDLSLAALRLDPPFEIRSVRKHTTEGPIVTALDQHFAVRAGLLVIRTAGHSLRIAHITLSTSG